MTSQETKKTRIVLPVWAAMAFIPGGWTACYFIGQAAQAWGMGWFK